MCLRVSTIDTLVTILGLVILVAYKFNETKTIPAPNVPFVRPLARFSTHRE